MKEEGRWMLEWQVKQSDIEFSIPVLESQGPEGGKRELETEGT